MNELHLIAIVHKRSLRSIRDLTSEHLPLLRNIRDQSLAAIEEQFNVAKSQVRAYFHYQPSYYHLHVHFVSMSMEQAPGATIERGHLLDTVIANLELVPDFYQRCTLTFGAKKGTGLYEAVKDHI